MSSKKRHCDLSLRALILLACLFFFILGGVHKTKTTSSLYEEQHEAHQDSKVVPSLGINKRRVPNGSDPIHNRKAIANEVQFTLDFLFNPKLLNF
ncbi:hypothetical protein L1987_62130 [Smallanthus sonchifolius]|uniref:Uncharacterized protein n=1 Tax=Smallanthus sonchifolius TaxID=185202 RepID=A0ACB9C9J7_9ASTR|nr:hypothetical protein L1987_62130 [Smallanthus sonchifolius]